MSHFHLKYVPRSGSQTTNFNTLFYSEIDALNAAGLANATRGKESGYYGVQNCRICACAGPPKQVAAPRLKGSTGAPPAHVAPRAGTSN